MPHFKNILLYHFEQCPYCRKVRDFLEINAIQLPMVDILINSDAKADLIQIGGKSQVPCLVIDGSALYESNDIIQWIQENRSIL